MQNFGKRVSYSDYSKLGYQALSKGYSKKSHVEYVLHLQSQDQQWQQNSWFIKDIWGIKIIWYWKIGSDMSMR